jgi:hypothetical protein
MVAPFRHAFALPARCFYSIDTSDRNAEAPSPRIVLVILSIDCHCSLFTVQSTSAAFDSVQRRQERAGADHGLLIHSSSPETHSRVAAWEVGHISPRSVPLDCGKESIVELERSPS